MTPSSRHALFFDRDDTLIRCTGHAPHNDLGDPALVEPLPGAVDAVRRAHEAGYFVGVVTNQGGVARGRYTEDDVRLVNRRVNEVFGGLIDDFRFCPWHPYGAVPQYTREHPWRKPEPGMLLDLIEAHALDPASSWMIGDAPRDCEAGRAAGCRTILLRNADPGGVADRCAPDALAAVALVLGR